MSRLISKCKTLDRLRNSNSVSVSWLKIEKSATGYNVVHYGAATPLMSCRGSSDMKRERASESMQLPPYSDEAAGTCRQVFPTRITNVWTVLPLRPTNPPFSCCRASAMLLFSRSSMIRCLCYLAGCLTRALRLLI